jgi:hypothetical protein
MTRNVTLSIMAVVVAVVTIVVLINVFFGAQSNIMKSFSYNKELSAKASLPPTSFFRLIQTIPIPNVNGRIDHMAIDIRGQKLFVAELENNSVDLQYHAVKDS